MSEMKKCSDLRVLHVNMIEEILAWLPVEFVCRFRSVSKEWNVLLSSREFITNKWVKKLSDRNPWLVVVPVAGSWLITAQGSKKWLQISSVAPVSLASCFFNQTWKEASSVSLSFLQQYSKCYGSAAGLCLCRTTAFVVCNPLTRRSLELPTSSLNTIVKAGITSHSGDAYKVVVVGTVAPRDPLQVEIYDSIDKSWRVAGRLPENVNWDQGRKLVFCDGYFYLLGIISMRRTVVVYNIGEGTFILRPLPLIAHAQYYMVPHLLTCGSRVLVAANILGIRGELLEVVIWEFEKVNMNSSSSSSWWKEIARMPPSQLERYCKNGTSLWWCAADFSTRCIGVGDSAFFIVSEQGKVKEILAYSVTENTWSWLPNRPPSTWDGFELPMAFEPRPDMKVD